MEKILARIFLIVLLCVLTFVFYLQVNQLGMLMPIRFLMSVAKRKDEIECFYFTGVTIQKITFHNAQLACPNWVDIF